MKNMNRVSFLHETNIPKLENCKNEARCWNMERFPAPVSRGSAVGAILVIGLCKDGLLAQDSQRRLSQSLLANETISDAYTLQTLTRSISGLFWGWKIRDWWRDCIRTLPRGGMH